ncbi:MAG: MerR family transcriptional regulator [Candidatus Dormibacterales bacterium]
MADAIGVTARVLRYWEEQGLISPTREHGRLRYSLRDKAIARVSKRLLDAGASVDGLRAIKDLSRREVRWAAEADWPSACSTSARRSGRRPGWMRSTTPRTVRRRPTQDLAPVTVPRSMAHAIPGPKAETRRLRARPGHGSSEVAPIRPRSTGCRGIDSKSFSSTLEQEREPWPQPRRRPKEHKHLRGAPAQTPRHPRDSAPKKRPRRASVSGN